MTEFEKAKQIVESIAESCACYVLGFSTHRHGNRTFVRIIAEYESGINIDQLTEITRKIKENPAFDAQFDSDYQLEVTSSGLDYHLQTVRDFRRKLGKEIKIFHRIEGVKSPLIGIVTETGEDTVTLSAGREIRTIPIDDIDYGIIVLKW